MKNILHLIKKDYIIFWHDKPAFSLTFIVPVFLIYLFGSIFSGPGNSPSGIQIAFINNSDSKIAKKLESVLDTTKTFQLIRSYTDDKGKKAAFDTNTIKDYIRKGNASAALVIPRDAFTDTSMGLKLKFYYDPKNEMEMQLIEGLLTKSIMSQMPGLFMTSMQRRSEIMLGSGKGKSFNKKIAGVVSQYFNVDTAKINKWMSSSNPDSMFNDTTSKKANFFIDLLRIDKEQLVGKEINNPGATRSVGGWAIMFLLFSLSGASTSLLDENKSRVILRILSAPVSREQILFGKYLYNFSLGCIQLLVMFFAGYVLFHIDIFSNFFNLLLIIIAASLASTAFGMFLAAVSRTQSQASGLGTLLILTMSAIGGAWFPTFILPPFIQILSKFSIVYWSMEGFMDVLWRGSGTLDILPYIGILVGMAAIVNIFSIIRFKKGNLFL
ncbi:MAG: ABC transporter permease [Ignavibacteriaceae bacterium]